MGQISCYAGRIKASKAWEGLRVEKKWYAAGLGFVLFLCLSAESLVNLLF